MSGGYETILEFWFGSGTDDEGVAKEKSALWWSKRPGDDHRIHELYRDVTEAAARGELGDWTRTARGLLALVIVTDQFPRCLFRGTGRAFAYDHLARQWCDDALSLGYDRELRPIERAFLYLPLEHAECPRDQERSVDLYTRLVDAAPASARAVFEGFLDYAVRHREVIDRFGRFPHRNHLLGRESTPAEAAFLAQPGAVF